MSRAAIEKVLRNEDRRGELIIDAVSSFFDGDHASASVTGDHRDRFAAVTTQREEKSIHFLVVRFKTRDDVLSAFFCVR